MLTTDPHDMGDQDAQHDDHECDCSVHNAQTLHELVAGLATHHGFDVCDPEHMPDDDDDRAMDLLIIHDTLVGQGAHCEGLDGDDEDDDDEDDSGEFDVSRFSDDDDDTDDDDTDDFDIIDLDGVGDDEDDDEPSAAMCDTSYLDSDINSIHDLATFDLGSPTDDGEFVRYEGARIFRPGQFPKKSFSMTPEELASAVGRCKSPIPAEIEHVNSAGTATFLDGEFGTLENVRLAEDGWMVGDVVLDRWVDRKWDKFLEKAGETRKQVSAVWNRATKDIERLGLVIKGHVEGAELNAAFSDKDDDSAIDAMFATPRKHDGHLSRIWQMMHDQAAMVPGICPGNSPAAMGDVPKQLKHLKSTHDHATEHGAVCPGKAMMSTTLTGTNSMSTATDSVAFADSPEYLAFQAKLEAAEAKAAELSAKLAETSAESAATAAQFAATKAELEVARVKQVAIDAKAFALAEITAGRSTAAEYKDLIADFSDAAEADHKSKELVTFSDATGASVQGTRVDKLRAREARRQSHGLFSPALGDGALTHDGERLLFNDKGTDNAASDRAAADAVLAKFNDGQAVLNRRKAAK